MDDQTVNPSDFDLSIAGASPLSVPSLPGHSPPPWNARPRIVGKLVTIPITYGVALPTKKPNLDVAPIAFERGRPRGAWPSRKRLIKKRRLRAAQTETP